MKTIKQWLEGLPNGVRQNAIEQCDVPDLQYETLYEAVGLFAAWHITREGYVFWMNVSYGAYSEALSLLRQNKPDVYNEYYTKYTGITCITKVEISAKNVN